MARPSEKVTLDESLMGDINFALPEHVLWLAVIERAMMDYIGRTACLSKPTEQSVHDFFFEDVARPNNLKYICDNLFDFPDAVPMIRKRVMQLAELWKNKDKSSRANNYYVISNCKRRVG
jgi:hypothetical protein